MKKIIATMLGSVLATSSFAAINCVKNDNCAKDQLKQLTDNEDMGFRNIKIRNASSRHSIYVDTSAVKKKCFHDYNHNHDYVGPQSTKTFPTFKEKGPISCGTERYKRLDNIYFHPVICKNGGTHCDYDNFQFDGPWIKVNIVAEVERGSEKYSYEFKSEDGKVANKVLEGPQGPDGPRNAVMKYSDEGGWGSIQRDPD